MPSVSAHNRIVHQRLTGALPAESFASAAKALKSKILVVGHTSSGSKDPVSAQRRYIARLHDELPASYAIWIGGRLNFDISFYRELRDVKHISNLEDFETQLDRVRKSRH